MSILPWWHVWSTQSNLTWLIYFINKIQPDLLSQRFRLKCEQAMGDVFFGVKSYLKIGVVLQSRRKFWRINGYTGWNMRPMGQRGSRLNLWWRDSVRRKVVILMSLLPQLWKWFLSRQYWVLRLWKICIRLVWCKDCFFSWRFEGGDLYVIAKGIWSQGKENFGMST